MTATVKQVQTDLVGDNSIEAWNGFALAVNAYTRWPVDGFAVNLDGPNQQTIYWVQGNSVGTITATGNHDAPTVTGTVRPVSDIANVDLAGTVDDSSTPALISRAITVIFRTGAPITVDQSASAVNGFIDALLTAIAAGPPQQTAS